MKSEKKEGCLTLAFFTDNIDRLTRVVRVEGDDRRKSQRTEMRNERDHLRAHNSLSLRLAADLEMLETARLLAAMHLPPKVPAQAVTCFLLRCRCHSPIDSPYFEANPSLLNRGIEGREVE